MKKTILTFFTISCLLSILLLIGLAFNIQTAKADYTWTETIYIKADGSVTPDTAPISTVDTIIYTLTDNIVGDVPEDTSAIVVERDNIIIDGAGYKVQGTGERKSKGIDLSSRNNVTLRNVEVTNFDYACMIRHSSNNILVGNTASNTKWGIYLAYSSNNTLDVNSISNNERTGIHMFSSKSNIISGNIVSSKGATGITGIYLVEDSSNNVLSGNTVSNNYYGIGVHYSNNNSFIGNTAFSNTYGIYLDMSSNSVIAGNNASDNGIYGICLFSNSHNTLIGNTASSNNKSGIYLSDSSNNTLTRNTVLNNDNGIRVVSYSRNNTFTRNTVAINNIGIYHGGHSSNNTHFHNSLLGNTFQAEIDTRWANLPNTWDNGYEGNYWSDYEGTDLDGDGIGDTSYVIDEDNRDRYPLMTPTTPPPLEHELVTSIKAPTSLQLGNSLSLNATVYNLGLNDESNVELVLLVNGTIVDSATISLLQAGDSYTLSYLWTPTAEGTYNVTAHVPPLPEEGNKVNNQNTKFTTICVRVLGVRAGDWIKYDYTYEESPEIPHTKWVKVEFLSVVGATVTMRGTLHLSNGTEQSETFTQDIVAAGPWHDAPVFDTLTGFVMLANSTVGDMAYIGDTDGKPCARITLDHRQCFGSTIKGETERTYVGTLRTVVYATYSTHSISYGPLTCYWDKQTGVLVEVCNTRSDGWTAKATETNIQAIPEFPSFLILPLFMITTLLAVIVYRRKHST